MSDKLSDLHFEMYTSPSHTIITAAEAKALDAKTSEDFGIDAFTLMEIAGFSAAKIIRAKIPENSSGLFLCGKGNNGGDALAAARYLAQHGFEVTIVFVSGRNGLSPLAQKNAELLQKIKKQDSSVSITLTDNWTDLNTSNQPDFIVDGMLGIGLNSDLRGDILSAVQWINNQKAPCFAMDIPTGLHSDSGLMLGEAVKADHTLSFGSLKQGFYLNDGFKRRGEVHLCELPFPNYLKSSSAFLMDESSLTEIKRAPAEHKYEAGVVYVIGGSEGLTGAAIMAAKSAWGEGVGAVIAVCPRGLLPILENNLPQIIKKPVGHKDDLYFKKEHLQEVSGIVQEKEGTALIGPGIGRNEDTAQFVNNFLEMNNEAVADADALWALSKKDNWQAPSNSSHILTPHPGELKRLLGEPVDDDFQRLQKVREMAAEKNVTLLSKGFPAMVGTARGEIFLSGYDTRRFSRAGFGDVLAGKVAAYKAMGYPADVACVFALLSGEKKMKRLLQNPSDHIPEPADFI